MIYRADKRIRVTMQITMNVLLFSQSISALSVGTDTVPMFYGLLYAFSFYVVLATAQLFFQLFDPLTWSHRFVSVFHLLGDLLLDRFTGLGL